MRRRMIWTVACCGWMFLPAIAQAQVTRLTKLNFDEPPALRDEEPAPDPYRAMQVAYQGEPADYAPTLTTPPLGAGNTTVTTPGAVTPGARVIVPGPATVGPTTVGPTTVGPTTTVGPSTIIGPAAPGACGCRTAPSTVRYAPAPAISTPCAPAPVVNYAPAATPVVVQQYVPVAAPATQAVVGATGTAPIVRAGLPPLLPVTPSGRPVFVSDGLLGQPVVYVPGQPLRNFLRYLTP